MAEKSTHIFIMGEPNFQLAVRIGTQQNPPIEIAEVARSIEPFSGIVFVSATITQPTQVFWDELRIAQQQLPPPKLRPIRRQIDYGFSPHED